MSTHAYPVRVDATLDEGLSRWLWLVKWFLAIPHFLVLALLWPAFLVLSVVALVAIVFTGRYPRGIFDFNVGVLRWTWRVGYYAYSGLGTDHYPPFSLQDRADFPAHLEVAYPEHLSRGLVLVKWWLLAIPHYLVIGLLAGGGWYLTSGSSDDWGWVGSGGLIGLLVLVAAVILLVTGTYPREIFDLVLGLNRWVLRVAAYAGLMTDDYPPFRLDMGGADPGSVLVAPPPPAATGPVAQPSQPSSGRDWGVGRVLAVLVASMMLITAAGLLVSGLVLRVADGAARDADGYLTTSGMRLESPGYALTSEEISIHGTATAVELPQRFLGTVKVEAIGLTGNGVFVGIGDSDDVDDYLDGVATSVVTDPAGDDGESPTYEFTDGGSPRAAPTDETFWVASATGQGEQSVTWEPGEGDWTIVVMNGEGTTPVSAEVEVGATVPALDSVAYGLLIAGSVLLLGGGLVLWLAVRTRQP
ncbi:DUF4389 domain-containing protein [Nocardioides sp.]|uniref:DUF4389 domain-containing protein n=1 Tax=Nocardioides sp. TaxID=35761 RepID=UPI002734850E|nr:DUF4389 domain-containing protein [Nocardioides sp.]MDP3893879.1 DUF4389 domain-containing protein [Nocardioides sp.]